MKLIRYEIKKALSGRFWILTLLLLLGLNTVLFMEPWNPGDMLGMGKVYRSHKPLLDFLYSADSEAYQSYIDDMTTKYGDEWQHSYVEYGNDGIPGRFLPTAVMELSVLNRCSSSISILFPQILEDRMQIVESARRLGGIAYAEDDYYGMRLNLDIIKRYKVKPALLPALATAENEGVFWIYVQIGWKHFFNYKWGTLFAILFTLLISSRAFSMENKTATILYTSSKGRRHTALAKLTASAVISILVSFVFSLLNIALTGWKYGLGGINASIISVLQFSLGPLNLTIGQTVLLFTLYQAFGVLCISIVVAALSCILKGILLSYLGSILFLGGSYGYNLLANISFNMPLALRSLPDVTVWTRPGWMYETYRVLNLFSYPVRLDFLCLCFWMLIMIGLYILTAILSEKGVRPR